MNKQLNVEFNELASGSGIVDIAIRFDTKTGQYNFALEENGLPTTLPLHVFNGIMFSVMNAAVRGTISGYKTE